MARILKNFFTGKNVNIFFLSFITLTFLCLLYKNPFSERSLIPNLEPFPDSIHYLNPALSFIDGKGLVIEREGRSMNTSVPFLYSAVLIPGFFLVDDVRFFYLTNVLLALLGLFFMYKFLRVIIPNRYPVFLVLFLYITNYFIYWFPNLPMAENLIIPLYALSLYLLFSKLTLKKAILAAVVGIGFYATKYASLILTLTFLSLYLLKILLVLYPLNNKKFSLRLQKAQLIIPAIFAFSVTLSFASFFLVEFLTKGNNILYQVYELMMPIFVSQPAAEVVASAPVDSWFSLNYFSKNFPIYLNAIMGNSMRFLWDFTPIVPKYIAIPALIGIFAGLLTKGFRFISFSLLLLILTPIIFISTFYSTDARYIYTSIPSLLAGFGLFLNLAYLSLKGKKLQKIFYLSLVIVFLFYSFSNFYRLKSQVSLNLRYAETPWYYISAKTFNEFFAKYPKSGKPPILITSIPPYYLDFYNNSGYKLLPLSPEQEFFRISEIAWGPEDYSDYIKLYKKYIDQGNDVFVTNAALGGVGYLYRDYNLIKDNFTLSEVHKGCLDTCNIYKLSPKN